MDSCLLEKMAMNCLFLLLDITFSLASMMQVLTAPCGLVRLISATLTSRTAFILIVATLIVSAAAVVAAVVLFVEFYNSSLQNYELKE